MDIYDGLQLKFIDEIVADTEEYTLKREFRISNMEERDVLMSQHDDIYHLSIQGDGLYVLDASRQHPAIRKWKQSEDERESEDNWKKRLQDFKELYGEQYHIIDNFQKDRFVVSTDNGIPSIDRYRLVDADNNILSDEYIHMRKCDGYCTVGRLVDNGFLYGLIDRDGKEVMPCKYDLATLTFIPEGCNRAAFFYGGRTGVMDFSGRIILSPELSNIDIGAYYLIAQNKKEDKWYAFTKNGTMLLDTYRFYLGSRGDRLIAYQDDYADVYSIRYKNAVIPDRGNYNDLPNTGANKTALGLKVSLALATAEK